MERLPASLVRLDIAADEDEYARALDRAFRKVATQIAVPGFRRGKAPRAMIERMYGREVYLDEANRELMEDLYRRALEQEELTPVGPPEVELVMPEPLAFTATVPVYPTIDPGPYADVRVEPVAAGVDDADVDEVLERLRASNSPWVDPPEAGMELGPDKVLRPKRRTPRAGDQVTVDYAVREGEQEFQDLIEDALFVLGESQLFPRLREEIERLVPGEVAEFEIDFAADDETVNPDIRGKHLGYTVTLKGIKERELLPLDDEFARTVLETDTLEELRREIRDDLHQGRTTDARAEVVSAIVAAIAETATVDPPAAMVDEEISSEVTTLRGQLVQRRTTLEDYLRANGQSEDELREAMRPEAARRLRNSLMLRAIAEREEIAVGDAEVDAEIERLVAPGGTSADPERLRQLYGSDYFRGILRGDLFERRLTDRLIEIATEGRGATIGGWVAPAPTPAVEGGADAVPTAAGGAADVGADDPIAEAGADAAADGAEGVLDDAGESALDRALTTGAMPGQPGDLAEGVAVPVSTVAAEPDTLQAAAAGSEAETAATDADEPATTGAVTETETGTFPDDQAEPGEGGSNAPNPSY